MPEVEAVPGAGQTLLGTIGFLLALVLSLFL